MSRHELPETGWKGIVNNFRADFLAAISVSLVALPLGLGIAAASGAPPISGLISAIIGGLIATPFRGSHLTINGPAASLIAVILSSIYTLDDGTGQTLNYVLAAICIAGAFQVLLGALKMGRIAEIVPSSVIQGLMVSIGIIIFSTQIHIALGTSPTGRGAVTLIKEIFTQIPNIHPVIFGISALGIFVLAIISKIQSRFLHYFPASLWVLVISVIAAYLFNFFEPHTVDIIGKQYHLGPDQLIKIPDNLWDAIIYPNFGRIGDYKFWLSVLSITLIASIATLAMAKAVDKLDPYKRKTDLNKDLIGVGLATMVAGAIGGLPIIAVVVRSTVNVNNNAKTKWSNFYHGILLIMFLFLLAPLIQKIPLAALAAILVYIGFRLASPAVFKKIYAMGIEQLIFMVVTLAITLYSDLLWGIIGGTFFALMVHILLSRMSFGEFFKETFSKNHKMKKTGNRAHLLEIGGIANFLRIPSISKITNQISPGDNVIIDLSKTRLVGMTFMEYLVNFLKMQRSTGGTVEIVGLDAHLSSSSYNKALKVAGSNSTPKLSPRQNRLQVFANENNLQYNSHVDWDTSYLKNFHFFNTRQIERKSNCLKGQLEDIGTTWEMADVTFSEGTAFNADVFNATLIVLRLNKKIPVFSIEKETVVEKIFDRVMAFTGYEEIDFKMFPGFSKKYLLMGNNEEEIRAFFSKDIITFLEQEQIFHIESNGEALLIFGKLKLARTDETIKFIDFGRQLARLINERPK